MQAGQNNVQVLPGVVINIQLALKIDNIGLYAPQHSDSMEQPGDDPHILEKPEMRRARHCRTMIGYGQEFDASCGCRLNIFGKGAVGMTAGHGMGMAVYLNMHEKTPSAYL